MQFLGIKVTKLFCNLIKVTNNTDENIIKEKKPKQNTKWPD